MRDISIKAFPAGRWWIRWIDHVWIDPGSPDPLVHVVLSPYQEGRGTESEHLRATSGDEIRAVSCGLIPKLAIGDVYRDGRPERHPVFKDRVRSVFTWRFEVTVSPYSGGVRALDQPLHGPTRRLPDLDPTPILAEADYPGLVTRKSKCVVVKERRGFKTLIPAIEVIRSLMAPHGAIVRALLASEWDDAVRSLVDSEATSVDAPPGSVVHLREGLPAWCAPYLANMLPQRGEMGPCAARQVHAGLLSPDPDLATGGREAARGVPADSANLSTTLPFDEDWVTLRMLGFSVDDKTFFAAKVVGGTWPDGRPLSVTYPEGSEELSDRTMAAGSHGRVALARRRASVVMRTGGKPHRSGNTLAIGAESVAWEGLPDLAVAARPLRALPPVAGVVRSDDVVPPVEVATAPAGRWGSGRAAHVVRTPAPEACAIFDRAAGLMRSLEERGFLWGVHTVPATKRGGRRGDHDVWHVEGSPTCDGTEGGEAWARIVPGEDHPRAILVLAARVELFGDVRWFEVERRTSDGRETESYRAVIAAFAVTPAPADVMLLVERLARARGRVRDLNAFVAGTDATGAATFKHSAAAGGFRHATVLARIEAALRSAGPAVGDAHRA